jgi:hypothetical protein
MKVKTEEYGDFKEDTLEKAYIISEKLLKFMINLIEKEDDEQAFMNGFSWGVTNFLGHLYPNLDEFNESSIVFSSSLLDNAIGYRDHIKKTEEGCEFKEQSGEKSDIISHKTLKFMNCDMCGSKVEDSKCNCGTWKICEETHDLPMKKALEEFHEMKRFTFTGDMPQLGCAVVFFRGDYNDCEKIKKFIHEMKGRKF